MIKFARPNTLSQNSLTTHSNIKVRVHAYQNVLRYLLTYKANIFNRILIKFVGNPSQQFPQYTVTKHTCHNTVFNSA